MGQSILWDWPNYFIYKQVNCILKQNSENVGAEKVGEVNVSFATTVPEVDASGPFLLAGSKVALFPITIIHKKNTKFRMQKYEI